MMIVVVAIIVCSCIICLLLVRNHREHMEKLDERGAREERDADALPPVDNSPEYKRRVAMEGKKLRKKLRPSIDAHRAKQGLPPIDWERTEKESDDE